MQCIPDRFAHGLFWFGSPPLMVLVVFVLAVVFVLFVLLLLPLLSMLLVWGCLVLTFALPFAPLHSDKV